MADVVVGLVVPTTFWYLLGYSILIYTLAEAIAKLHKAFSKEDMVKQILKTIKSKNGNTR